MKLVDRRSFLKKIGVAGAVASSFTSSNRLDATKMRQELTLHRQHFGKNDKVRLAMIGCGIQGFANAEAANQVPGVELVAACDLYQGRLTRMKEVFGNHLLCTKDYQAILDRSDVDAVCVSTTDHWHDHIVKLALAKGKPVYCEKPMVHRPEEGLALVEAEQKSKLPVQIGSQRASSLSVWKAKELLAQGVIGEINMADIRYDRNSSNGAWQYSIPTDASIDTIDWKTFIGDAPVHSFDPVRFFRWRNYRDYGTGVAGDLFVHLFTALHVITGSLGPDRVYSTGGLRFWKDGRDVPDITLGLYDYPETSIHPAFNVQMRSNFVDGSGGGSHVQLIGSEGMMTIGWNSIRIQKSKVSTVPSFGGWDSFSTFSEAQQKDFEKWFKEHYPAPKPEMNEPRQLEYTEPEGYDAHVDHWAFFVDAIHNRTKLIEDTSFGLRAAGPSLAANMSLEQKKIIHWDPTEMKIVQ